MMPNVVLKFISMNKCLHVSICLFRFEGVFARWADGHLCVSNAMKEDLMKNWGIKRPVTLYDRPPKVFKETPLEIRHEVSKDPVN